MMSHHPLRIAVVVAVLLALGSGVVWWKARHHRRLEAILPRLFQFSAPHYTPSLNRTYSTNFPDTENVISENHAWVNGGTCGDPLLCPGGNGSNIQTIQGHAFGTQAGKIPPPYTDSGALVTGNWGSDQFVQIVIWWDGVPETNIDFDEVEIRLRGTFGKDWSRTYNINCRVGTPSQDSYIQMGRANGPPDNFTPPFVELHGPSAACQNRDVITGTVVGDVITAYINGRKVLQARDSVISSGAPGFGFFHQGMLTRNTDFGVSSFTASDLFPRLAYPGATENPVLPAVREQPK